MQAGNDFRPGVASVVDDGLLQSPEAGRALNGHVVDVQRSEDVHHVVGHRLIDEVAFPLDLRIETLRPGLQRSRLSVWRQGRGGFRTVLSMSLLVERLGDGAGGSADGSPFQEIASALHVGHSSVVNWCRGFHAGKTRVCSADAGLSSPWHRHRTGLCGSGFSRESSLRALGAPWWRPCPDDLPNPPPRHSRIARAPVRSCRREDRHRWR